MGCGTLGAWLVALHDVYGQSGWQKGSAFHTPSGLRPPSPLRGEGLTRAQGGGKWHSKALISLNHLRKTAVLARHSSPPSLPIIHPARLGTFVAAAHIFATVLRPFGEIYDPR